MVIWDLDFGYLGSGQWVGVGVGNRNVSCMAWVQRRNNGTSASSATIRTTIEAHGDFFQQGHNFSRFRKFESKSKSRSMTTCGAEQISEYEVFYHGER
ncbi:hypothetical protein LWI29_004901 [Acer saccharum]|uniref:Uncharacterized protein n=1 Tax=Acer saccharum TaxID=4024 RepID=A0AA39W203_ACESA|nr:hypothetical protein LWI29_004901 [Acer saccharum]